MSTRSKNTKVAQKPKAQNQQIVRKNAPVSTGTILRTTLPAMTPINQGTRVKHSELIKDINGTTSIYGNAFETQINPGLATIFPWLSSIARQYESYNFRDLKFRYETSSPTSTTGWVALSVDYDPEDASPDNKISLMAAQSTVRGAPWENFTHRSTTQNLSKRKTYFTRQATTSITDLDTHDIGRLTVAVGSQASSAAIGELWVDYTVDLTTPQLQFPALGSAVVRSGGSASLSNPLGTAGYVSGTAGLDISVTSAGQVQFHQAFEGVLQAYASGTGIISTSQLTFSSLGGGLTTAAMPGGMPTNTPNLGATYVRFDYRIKAPPGGIFALECLNMTSVSNCILFLSSGSSTIA